MKIRNRVLAVVFIGAIAFAGMFGCSKQSGDDSLESGGETTISALESARNKLAAGDVPGARQIYDQILSGASPSTMPLYVSGSKNTSTDGGGGSESSSEAYFGRAFCDMLLLAESTPANDLLALFGESPLSLSTMIGPTGFLAKHYELEKADEVDLRITGDVAAILDAPYGETSVWGGDGQDTRVSGKIGNSKVLISFYVRKNSFVGGSSVCEVTPGATIRIDEVCDVGSDNDNYLVEIFVSSVDENGRNKYFSSMICDAPPDGGLYYSDCRDSTGSVTVNEIGGEIGGALSLTFNDITLINYNVTTETITLNGTFVDQISDRSSIEYPNAPFHGRGNARKVLGSLEPDLRSSAVIAKVYGFMPLIDPIISDLTSAAADPAASYVVPSGFLSTRGDLNISHSDMLAMLGSMQAAKAALHLANSWTADIALGGLFNAEGRFIGSKRELVDQLNTFFRLKDPNELQDAKAALTASFASLLAAFSEIQGGGDSGLIAMTAETAQVFAELSELVTDADASLSGPTSIRALHPPIVADLSYVFAGKVDGNAIEMDPFVLEDSNIKPVEAYFVQLMGSATNYSISNRTGEKLFSPAIGQVPHLVKKLFPQIMKSRLGGYVLDRRVDW